MPSNTQKRNSDRPAFRRSGRKGTSDRLPEDSYKEDFQLLPEIDNAAPDDTQHSEEALRLLYNLALLEYNAYWWRSHPVVRTLPGYKECRPEKRPADETA